MRTGRREGGLAGLAGGRARLGPLMPLFLLQPRVPWPPRPAAGAESVASGGTCLRAGWPGPRPSSSGTPAWMSMLAGPRHCTGPVPATMPPPCACCFGSGLTLPAGTATETRRCTLPPAGGLVVSVPAGQLMSPGAPWDLGRR